jgi:hypothetical protein
MPTETLKQMTIRALLNMRGDDHIRAANVFRGLAPEQMQDKHGQSGRTRQQILNDCNAHVDRVNAAIAWVQAQPE